MRRGRSRLGAALALFAAALAGRIGSAQAPELAENVFRNIQVLKGIPADEFMDTMGMFASSLLFDCTGCHVQEILSDRSAFAIATPRIQRARQMVVMVNTINKTYFAGQPRVTCFTCHRGDGAPEAIPDLAVQYGDVSYENSSAIRIFPDARLSPDTIFARYLQALGGAERVRALASVVATGTYAGFNTGSAKVPIEIYARAPNQRTQVVKTFEGDAIFTYDGKNAWAAEGWRQLPLMTFTGSNLAAARVDAVVAFPGGIQQAYRQWQAMATTIDDRNVQLLQGSSPGELPVNFYFDEETGLLVRTLRWSRTPVGTIPTQVEYGEYREVAGSGVRMPFRLLVRWTNGQNAIELSDIRPNVAIEAARFARPAPFKGR
ncbi:MAG: photosynthetic reaction center cytochrome c subunit [Acidobacteria bacterium]|nr:photosynthetic reaction center cytochrome c subunit [Acidobacteriota bacterium]